MKILFVFILALSVSFAQDCAKIEENEERLACYDEKSKPKEEPKGENPASEMSNVEIMGKLLGGEVQYSDDEKWLTLKRRSPVDDSLIITVTQKTNDGDSAMIIRCQENTTDLFFGYDAYLGNNYSTVTYRIDKEKAVKARWDVSTEGKTSFARRPISVIKSMLGKESFYIRVEPYSKNPIGAPYDIRGLEEIIKPLREACNW